jgi:hypothetical protein
MDGDVGSSLKSVHRTIHQRCPLDAKLGRIKGEQISSEMGSRAEIETGSIEAGSISPSELQRGWSAKTANPV